MTSQDGELFDQIGDVLGSRHGWRREPSTSPGAPPAWCLERRGEVELSVNVSGGTIAVYSPVQDRETRFSGVEALVEWIDGNEAQFLRP